jgi:DNA-binding SARP family transcriptional activator
VSRSDTAPSPLIRARLLGDFAVAVDGRPVASDSWRHGSATRLLKLLLLMPRHRLRRETAAELLWPSAPVGHGMTNLRRAHHFLVHALEREPTGPILLRQPSMVGLLPGVRLDSDYDALVAALERLDTAVASGGDVRAAAGRVLAAREIELLPDDPDEDWLVRRREQLVARWTEILVGAAAALDGCGDGATARRILRRVLDLDPAHEDAHRLVIGSFARDGNLHAARRQFEICRRELVDAYGLDPSPATAAALGSGGREA